MKVIISPAKKMNVDTDSFPCRDMPQFLPKARLLLEQMRRMTYEELKRLWRCSDRIARPCFCHLMEAGLERGLTPAVLAFSGIQYRYMAPGVFSWRELEYVQEHLRILSGFYGLLRPFDGVAPYRLEMGSGLALPGFRDLYGFWGEDIARSLFAEAGGVVLNLASREYSRCVTEYVPAGARVITCIFGQRQRGKIVEKGTLCKMARGEMVSFMAEEEIETPEGVQGFCRLGYRFSPEDSGKDTYVFIKEDKKYA